MGAGSRLCSIPRPLFPERHPVRLNARVGFGSICAANLASFFFLLVSYNSLFFVLVFFVLLSLDFSFPLVVCFCFALLCFAFDFALGYVFPLFLVSLGLSFVVCALVFGADVLIGLCPFFSVFFLFSLALSFFVRPSVAVSPPLLLPLFFLNACAALSPLRWIAPMRRPRPVGPSLAGAGLFLLFLRLRP